MIKEKTQVLFIIEGVLMYQEEEKVKDLFKVIAENFQNSYIIFDTLPTKYLSLIFHPTLDMSQSPFKWGISDKSEIEYWKFGLTEVSQHFYQSRYTGNVEFLKLRFSIVPELDADLKVNLMKTK